MEDKYKCSFSLYKQQKRIDENLLNAKLKKSLPVHLCVRVQSSNVKDKPAELSYSFIYEEQLTVSSFVMLYDSFVYFGFSHSSKIRFLRFRTSKTSLNIFLNTKCDHLNTERML